MSMDPWLARVYGTNGGAAEDLEKIAQAEMAQQLAQQEGIDLSGLNEEQIAALGQDVLQQPGQPGGQPGAQPQQPGQAPQQMGGQPGMPQQQQMGGQPGAEGQIDPSEITEEVFAEAQQLLQAAQQGQQVDPGALQEAQAVLQIVEQMQAQQAGQQPSQEMAKVAEAQAKFEEADFLGRVMAHSFHAETEKIAAGKLGPANAMGVAGHHARELGQKAMGGLKHLGHKAQEGAAHAGSHMHDHRGAYGLGAGAAAGAGAAHMMHKEATIALIEKAAMQQAANILQANGIDPATGQASAPAQQAAPQLAPAGGAPAPQAPGPGAAVALGDLVEKRAHQILRGLGYSI